MHVCADTEDSKSSTLQECSLIWHAHHACATGLLEEYTTTFQRILQEEASNSSTLHEFNPIRTWQHRYSHSDCIFKTRRQDYPSVEIVLPCSQTNVLEDCGPFNCLSRTDFPCAESVLPCRGRIDVVLHGRILTEPMGRDSSCAGLDSHAMNKEVPAQSITR